MFALFLSVVCKSQSTNFIAKDFSKHTLITNLDYSNLDFGSNSKKVSCYSFDLKLMSPQNGLFYDPQYYQ